MAGSPPADCSPAARSPASTHRPLRAASARPGGRSSAARSLRESLRRSARPVRRSSPPSTGSTSVNDRGSTLDTYDRTAAITRCSPTTSSTSPTSSRSRSAFATPTRSKKLDATFGNDNTACVAQQAALVPFLANPGLAPLAAGLIGLTCQGNSTSELNGVNITDDRDEDEFTGTGILSYKWSRRPAGLRELVARLQGGRLQPRPLGPEGSGRCRSRRSPAAPRRWSAISSSIRRSTPPTRSAPNSRAGRSPSTPCCSARISRTSS